MKIKYEFVTGETAEVEVSAEIAKLCIELDREEYNNNQAETRRHCCLDTALDHSDWLALDKEDSYNKYIAKEEASRMQQAMSELTAAQRDLIANVFQNEMPYKQYAEKIGVSPSAVSQQIRRIRKKLKKLL